MRNLALRSVFQAVNPAISVKSGNSLADGLKFCYVPNGQWNVKDLTGRTQQYGANSYGTSVADGPFGQSNMMYWSVGSDNTLLSGLKSLSISAIFKYTNTGSSSNLIVRKSYGFELGITYSDGTASLYFTTYVSSNGSTANTNSVTITVGQWYHCVVNQDASGNANVYLNGKLAFTVNPNGTTAPVFDHSYALTAGYTQFGAISNVSMWNRALTGGELSRLCANPLAMLDAGERWFAGVGASSSYSQTFSATAGSSVSRVRMAGLARSCSSSSIVSRVRAISVGAKLATSSSVSSRIVGIAKTALSATSSSAVSVIRALAKSMSSTSGSNASMSYGRVILRTFSAVAGSALAIGRSVGKSASASSGSSALIGRVISLLRSYSAASTGLASSALTKQLYRAYAAASSGSASVGKAIAKTVGAAVVGSNATMVYGRVLFRVAAATASGVASAAYARFYSRVIAASSTGVAAISRAMSITRSAVSSTVPSFTRAASLFRSISATVTSSLPDTPNPLPDTPQPMPDSNASSTTGVIAASSTGVAAISRAMSITRSAVSSTVPSFTRAASLFRSISATVTSSAKANKLMAKTFSALATSAAFASVVFGGGGGIVISTLRKVMVAFEQRCTSVAKEDRSVRPREED